MSNAVGSPRMMDTLAEADWDQEMWALIKSGDMEEITKRSTWDQLYAHGNGTPGFLGNVMVLGAAGGAEPSFAELLATETQPAIAFLGWTEADLEGRDT
jgi:protocatechuate 4,5-dioxygenase beta chain